MKYGGLVKDLSEDALHTGQRKAGVIGLDNPPQQLVA